MTKRFELRLCSNGTYYVYENGTLTDIDFDKVNRESAYALIDEVNALYEEKEELKIFLKAVNEELSLANRDCDILEDENKQLKQRNDRQAKQLGRLYSLIEEKDWIALFDIIDDFKRCEEQLQKEWETYDNFK